MVKLEEANEILDKIGRTVKTAGLPTLVYDAVASPENRLGIEWTLNFELHWDGCIPVSAQAKAEIESNSKVFVSGQLLGVTITAEKLKALRNEIIKYLMVCQDNGLIIGGHDATE